MTPREYIRARCGGNEGLLVDRIESLRQRAGAAGDASLAQACARAVQLDRREEAMLGPDNAAIQAGFAQESPAARHSGRLPSIARL